MCRPSDAAAMCSKALVYTRFPSAPTDRQTDRPITRFIPHFHLGNMSNFSFHAVVKTPFF